MSDKPLLRLTLSSLGSHFTVGSVLSPCFPLVEDVAGNRFLTVMPHLAFSKDQRRSYALSLEWLGMVVWIAFRMES